MEEIPSIWLTPQQIAEAIGIHVETVRRWLRTGVIKGIKQNRGPQSRWLIHHDELERFLASCVHLIYEID